MSIVSMISNFSADISRLNLKKSMEQTETSLAKISSGQRVFSAKEDPAALAIGSALATEVAALRSAQLNVAQGVSTLQIADGALGRMADIANRMKTLAAQSVSEQVSNQERVFIDNEYQQLMNEFDRISSDTKFNGVALLGGQAEYQATAVGANVGSANGIVGIQFNQNAAGGDVFEVSYYAPTKILTIRNATQNVSQSIAVDSPEVGFLANYTFERAGVTLTLNSSFDDTVTFAHAGANEEFQALALASPAPLSAVYQVGVATESSDRITVSIPVVNANSMNIAGSNLLTATSARSAIAVLDVAIDDLSSVRATVGAAQNRLEAAGETIAATIENSEAARSALLDVDISSEITEFSSKQVLAEAAINMLTRANQRPQVLLRLLEG